MYRSISVYVNLPFKKSPWYVMCKSLYMYPYILLVEYDWR